MYSSMTLNVGVRALLDPPLPESGVRTPHRIAVTGRGWVIVHIPPATEEWRPICFQSFPGFLSHISLSFHSLLLSSSVYLEKQQKKTVAICEQYKPCQIAFRGSQRPRCNLQLPLNIVTRWNENECEFFSFRGLCPGPWPCCGSTPVIILPLSTCSSPPVWQILDPALLWACHFGVMLLYVTVADHEL